MDTNKLIGLPLEEADLLCDHYNHRLRILTENGIRNLITLELRYDRVNVNVTDGVVTSIGGIY